MQAQFSWVALGLAAAGLCAAAPAVAQTADAPAPQASAAPADAAPQPVAQPKFYIEAYDVIGNTLLDPAVVDRTVYPFLGPDKTIDDVNRAREALEAEYRTRGFQAVSVSVLGTTENDTVVQFQVTEAKLGELKVTGAKYFSPKQILAQVPALQKGQVPNLEQAQAQLARLDRNQDRRVTPRVTLGQQPGTIDVTLEVEDKLPYHAGVTVSNDHSPNTSELRVLTQLRATNLWNLGHQFSFSYLVAPQRRADAEVFAGSYLMPIYNSPWSILIYGYRSNSNVALLGGATVLGNGYAVGVRGIYALPNAGRWSQSVNFGFDYKDFNENTRVPGADLIPAPIRYLPFAASYSANRVGDASLLSLTGSVTLGVRSFGDSILVADSSGLIAPQDLFENRRPGARENFVHVNLDLDWTRTLPDDTRIEAKLAAQYGDGPLISNEQFSAGGITSVRGYLQSESVGDDGVSGQFEVALPSIAQTVGKHVQDLRAYVFMDAAFVRNRQQLASAVNDFTLWSLGAGARAQLFKVLTGDVIFGVPLRSGLYTRQHVPTVYFNVKSDF